MPAGFVCYHHSNCQDRGAVATCSKCGKALCTECVDTLRSPNTGHILCVECLNAELRDEESLALGYREKMRKELVGMCIGGGIGLIAMFILIGSLGPISLLFPFLGASFVTIIHNSFGKHGFIVGLIFFLVMLVVSPIVLLVRILKRIKARKLMKEYAETLHYKRNVYAEYFKAARAMKSGDAKIDIKVILESQKDILSDDIKKYVDKAVNSSKDAVIGEVNQKFEDIGNKLKKVM